MSSDCVDVVKQELVLLSFSRFIHEILEQITWEVIWRLHLSAVLLDLHLQHDRVCFHCCSHVLVTQGCMYPCLQGQVLECSPGNRRITTLMKAQSHTRCSPNEGCYGQHIYTTLSLQRGYVCQPHVYIAPRKMKHCVMHTLPDKAFQMFPYLWSPQ